MSAHTPGPWHVNDQIRNQLYVEGEHSLVCDLQFSQADNPEDVVKMIADAWLIAAAPELLEACKLGLREAEAWIHGQLDDTAWEQRELDVLEPIRAAIAKAEGKATR